MTAEIRSADPTMIEFLSLHLVVSLFRTKARLEAEIILGLTAPWVINQPMNRQIFDLFGVRASVTDLAS